MLARSCLQQFSLAKAHCSKLLVASEVERVLKTTGCTWQQAYEQLCVQLRAHLLDELKRSGAEEAAMTKAKFVSLINVDTGYINKRRDKML